MAVDDEGDGEGDDDGDYHEPCLQIIMRTVPSKMRSYWNIPVNVQYKKLKHHEVARIR